MRTRGPLLKRIGWGGAPWQRGRLARQRGFDQTFLGALLACLLLLGCAEPPSSRFNVPGGGLRAALGEAAQDAGFARAERPIEFVFPGDHGPHPAFRSEWWYLVAVLADASGREFGAQFTLFRQGLAPRGNEGAVAGAGAAAWRSGQIFMGHAAVSDVEAERHWAAERLTRGHPALAGARAAPFEARIEGWRLESAGDGFWPLRLQAAGRGFEIDLTLKGRKPIVRQGEGGLSRKGPDNASYYYSVPRIAAAGRLAAGGERHEVRGDAWLDREWSTSVLAPEYAGWDWFALHFEDGRDLMLYQMRRVDGRADDYDSGALVDAGGAARILAASDFSLTPLRRWRGWPVAWRLVLGDAAYRIGAAFDDQVMDARVRYWEGVVRVRDEGGRRVGAGYMELTGY